jgi:hypothetical protein
MGLGFLIAALLNADCWNRFVFDAKPIPNPKDEVDSFFISLVFEIDLCSKLMYVPGPGVSGISNGLDVLIKSGVVV